MPQLIKNRAVVEDRWKLLRNAAGLSDVPGSGPVIVPLALWLAHREELLARGDAGVWLKPDDEPEKLVPDKDALPLVAVDFPIFSDGRGYSIGRLLRDRYGFKGELRAIGDILRDQLYALAECGFDAFDIRADRSATEALASFDDFKGVYATTSRNPTPWFRRRDAAPPVEPNRDAPEERVNEALALLREVASRHAPAVFASSFGAEDMVIIDLIARHSLPIGVFTLDTGRLPEETHDLIERVREKYGLPIDIYTPDAQLLQAFVRENGINAFYKSVDLRKACCGIRKTEPLQRALRGKGAWITGLRRAQSISRQDAATREVDEAHGIPKLNPLVDWSQEDVWDYLRAHGVPYNALHDRGYPSIGCAPCTRAVMPGEDARAGRWWWEESEHKECGLHRRPSHAPRTTIAETATP